MSSVNKVIIIGNLGRDPEVRTFPDGGRVANVTIATTDKWRDKSSGDMRESTEWHRVVFRDGLAGIVEQYLRKGSQVYVEGSIKTRKYQDQSGVEKSIVEIMAREMTMLGSRQDGGNSDGGQRGGADQQRGNGGQQRQQPSNQQRQQPQGNGQQRGSGGGYPSRNSEPQQGRGNGQQQAPRGSQGSGFDDFDSDVPF